NSNSASTPAIATLALLNAPEDIRDMQGVYKQISSLIKGEKFIPPYNYKIAQHPFSFFRGTLLNNFINPNTSPFPKLAKWLLKKDTTLLQTKLGDWVCKIFNLKEDRIKTQIKDITFTNQKPVYISAKVFEGNTFGTLTARALTRTPKLGVLALGAVEGIDILSDVANGENIFEATAKSATNLLGSITLSGYCGALGSKMFGVTGSMLGTGIGNFANNKLNNMFFN
ncbi:MAG: hypothetical protein Q4E83_03415, partial [bacterium]|nr:hypothetical protein [bacterium]